MSLGTPHNDAVRPSFHNAEEEVGILLGVRSQGAVTLWIRHGSVYGEIIFLCVEKKFLEIFKIIRAILFINFISGAVNCIEGIHSDTALEAGCRFLSAEALHFNFFNEILRALVNICKAVNLFPRQVGGGCH